MDNSYISIAAKRCIENSTIDTALFSIYYLQKRVINKNGLVVRVAVTT